VNVEELKALARAVEPLSTQVGDLDCREPVVAYNDLVSRFRERVTLALNSLSLFQVVEPELKQELRLLARDLPGLRSRAEAAAQTEPPGSGKPAALPAPRGEAVGGRLGR
jgi:hypothetical protein